MYGDSHVKDKTVIRPSYLSHGDPYIGKTISIYWDSPLDPLRIVALLLDNTFNSVKRNTLFKIRLVFSS